MQSIVDVWAHMCRRFPGMPIVLNRDPVAYGRPSAGDARVEFGNAYVMVRDGLVKAYHGAERLEASTIEDLAPILAADDNFNLFLVPEKRVEHDIGHWLPPCCQIRNARINVGGAGRGPRDRVDLRSPAPRVRPAARGPRRFTDERVLSGDAAARPAARFLLGGGRDGPAPGARG